MFQNFSQYYDYDCLHNSSLLFMSLLTAQIVKGSQILAWIYFILLKFVLVRAWAFFNGKFGSRWRDR